jgi:hypothetical protein
MADDAQPDEGQGNAAEGGLYDSYLQFVPPEYREQAQAALAADATKVNGRLEEAAQLRQTYEPLSRIEGLDRYDPDQLQQLLGWHQQVTSDDDAYREWLTEAVAAAGLEPAAQAAADDEIAEMTPESVRSIVEEVLQSNIGPLEERTSELANTQFVNSEAALVAERFAEIEREAGMELTTEQKNTIVDLGLAAMPDENASLLNGQDWISAGWDRFRDVFTQGQTAFVADKTGAPKPALTSGGVPVFEPPKTWAEGSARARERWRQSRA